ncbi:MAG: indolepyruvate oxidoreductase subunit beta [Ignisphaera sp.]|nr:indolepyruvate oxidoreductase subunit beta [Ignisphaera sp.]MCX8168580.1 indolepyruvate oxidoreductase subunit beta [Ignisphaera sp.]MDW8086260.1 indolepyruvate oxidoreductase subunit beta [Ignisphaera sp.]
MKLEIVITGVGGQGIITMSNIIGAACTKLGINVITAETHGMAQRMGSVEVFIRIGEACAPLVMPGAADLVVALEMIESLRAVRYLKKCGWLVISNIYLPPPGLDGVPARHDIINALTQLPIKMLQIDVENIMEKLGDFRISNTVMLGALIAIDEVSKMLPLSVVEDIVSQSLGSTNREAFLMGYHQALEKLGKRDVAITNACTL